MNDFIRVREAAASIGVSMDVVADFLEVTRRSFELWCTETGGKPRRGDRVIARWLHNLIETGKQEDVFVDRLSVGNDLHWRKVNKQRLQERISAANE